VALDIPSCIEGIDIGDGTSALAEAEELAAATWGARRTWFLVNGASEGSHVACLALAQAGPEVVVQRNVHASTMHGLVLAGIRPVIVQPEIDCARGMAHCVSPETLAASLDANPAASAAFVVSPTYFGACADVRGLAEVCHARGVPLVVDEAWGAHLHFHDRLPEDALAAGADLVLSGTHKLIGSLTQSAMLHLGWRRWPQLDEAAVTRALSLVRSTSPSSLLLGSLDAARAHVAARGAALLDEALTHMDLIKDEIRCIPGLDVLDDRLVGRHAIAAFDPLRLAIDLRGSNTDGYALARTLLQLSDVNLELITDRVVIAHVGIAEPVLESGLRLLEALPMALALAPARPPLPVAPPVFGEPVLAPREAFFGAHERVPLADVEGRISADSIAVYPPGIANVLPGERFTPELCAHLAHSLERGLPLKGTWDAHDATVRVITSQRGRT
jgi:lysine decarboxylase